MAATDDTDTAATDKSALRSRIRARRKARRRAMREAGTARTEEATRIAEAAIAHLDSCPLALAHGWGTPGATVAAFRSTPSEPDTSALLDALHQRGVRVLVPRTRADLTLDWHELLPPERRVPREAAEEDAASGPDSGAELPSEDDTDDEGPALGLDAVSDITAMILPGIAVDGAGHRLGQGGGCYDRTLPRVREDTCRAVLLFDDEVLAAVPHTDLDRPVPAVLTPGRGWTALAV